ncbi:MAG TPA: type II secretion system minor pseudopilin GspJ [Sphingomicrobium sp.]|nr:type II secretion system minor pseudopilin GspJ [Sphingomicrobium sp.]
MTIRDPEAGFTLVEMLVAMLIFAMLAVAGVGLLRASVDTQAAIDNRLGGINAQERIAALFTADVGQAIARPQLGPADRRQLSFRGTPSSISLVRGGWANPDGLPRSSLQRVEWTGSQSNVSRTAHLFLDGSDPGEPAVIQRDVASLKLRYRRADGSWSDSFSSTEREMLPAAVELTVRARGGQPLVVIAALPPRGPEPEDNITLASAGYVSVQ